MPLPGSSVPTGAFTFFSLVIAPPLGSFTYRGPKSPAIAGDRVLAGGFQFPGAAGQGPTVVLSQKFRKVGPTVNLPSNASFPVIGVAMAGTDSARSAPHTRPPYKTLVRFVIDVNLSEKQLSPPDHRIRLNSYKVHTPFIQILFF